MIDERLRERFAERTLRMDDLLDLLQMHRQAPEKSEADALLVDVFLAMHVLARSGRTFTLDWIRAYLPPPTHIAIDTDGGCELVYRFSGGHIGIAVVQASVFVEYYQVCCCDDWDAFWRGLEVWDGQMSWSGL